MSTTQYHGVSSTPAYPQDEYMTDNFDRRHNKSDPAASKASHGLQSHLINEWWGWELLSALVSLIAFAAIVGLLRFVKDKPVSAFHSSLTINALNSLIGVLLRTSMMVPVSQGISQLKWVWFHNRPRRLEDMAVFDDASRGIAGSLALLFHMRGKHLVSFGSIITILSLATGTFIQQAVHSEIRPILSSDLVAMIPRVGNISSDSAYTTQFSLISAFNAATTVNIVKVDNNTDAGQALAYSCPSGNCTWPIYSSLAVCSSCNNITNLLTIADSSTNTTGKVYQLPNGDLIETGEGVNLSFVLNSTIHETQNSTFTFQSSDQAFIAAFTFLMARLNPDTQQATLVNAAECQLSFCAQAYNSSVGFGKISQDIVLSWHELDSENYFVLPGNASEFNLDSQNSKIPMAPLEWVRNAPGGLLHLTGVGAVLRGGSSSSVWGQSILSGNLDAAPFFSSFAKRLSAELANLADKTNDRSPVIGSAFTQEQFFVVQFGWLVFPGGLIVLSFFFLIAAAIKSRAAHARVWKSSPLAILFHGLGPEVQREMGVVKNTNDMKQKAKQIDVSLTDTYEGIRLRLV